MAQQNQHNSLNNNIVYYRADIVNTSDYGTWGDPLPQRGYSSSAYKYGFNGKEKDDEISGNGNMYDYGFRIYNPRLGKFLSVDPLYKNFPELSTYQFSNNSPIVTIDLDGLEAINYRDIEGGDYDKAHLKVSDLEEHVVLTHTFNGKVSSLIFNKIGPSITDLSNVKESENETWEGIKLAWKYPEILQYKDKFEPALKLFATGALENEGSAPAEFYKQLFPNENFAHDLKGYYNTFRHVFGQALLTNVFGEKFAKFAGDAHERDANGINNPSFKRDAITDLINNMYGRKLGKELAKTIDIKTWTEKSTADYLNKVAEYVINSFPELAGKVVKFDPNSELVKKLTKAINEILNDINKKSEVKPENEANKDENKGSVIIPKQ